MDLFNIPILKHFYIYSIIDLIFLLTVHIFYFLKLNIRNDKTLFYISINTAHNCHEILYYESKNKYICVINDNKKIK